MVWPIFRVEYVNVWSSIESTFIADARLLREHLPHPGWQPLWYCGTRFDYIYPPALRYGTALISKLASISTARAYHMYTGALYVFGIAAVYWLVRLGSNSRARALLVSLATLLVSPSLLLVADLRQSDPYWIPMSLEVLTHYGEGPHISALCLLPAALAAAFVALTKFRPIALAAAGLLCAWTVANNFYGATALAMLFPVVVWSVWLGFRDRRIWLYAAGIVALAYGLSAFWLTPSYLRVTSANLRLVAQPGTIWSRVIFGVAIALYCAVSFQVGNRRPERVWKVFVAGAATVLGVYVLGFYYFDLRILGQAHRLDPELDLALSLLFAELVGLLWTRRKLRAFTIAATCFVFLPATSYFDHSHFPFRRAGRLQDQYEFQITQWVHEHLPDRRVLPAGSVRFWFDAWFDNGQTGGGSEQGMLNSTLPAAMWQIYAGNRGDTALLWLQATGTDAVIVPDNTSFDQYRDYAVPAKFRGLAPVLFDDNHGTAIYGVPRRYPGIGRVVNAARILEIDAKDWLASYVKEIESQDTPASVTWKGFDEMEVSATLGPGQAVLVQETFDPAWHADENGRSLPVRMERGMQFMLLDPGEGTHRIRVRLETPLENRLGQVGFALSILAIGLLAWRGKSL